MPSPVAALGVFLITYVLISLRTLGRFRLEKPATALLGAALMIALGVVSLADVKAIFGGPQGRGLEVILLLLGMMLLVGGLELAGFFDLVSREIVRRARDPARFLVMLMGATALLSALVLNDTIVLLFTPVVVKSCRALGLNPIPYLVGEAMAANVGSVATEVGNPQIAVIALESGIPFGRYTALMLPLTLLCLGLSFYLIRWIYRAELSERTTAPLAVVAVASHNPGQGDGGPPLGFDLRRNKSLVFLLGIVACVVVAFFLTSFLPWNLALVAFVGGSVATFALPAFGTATARDVLRRVDWSILLFFIGLFIVIQGVEVSGLLQGIVGAFDAITGGDLSSAGWLTLLSSLLSNAISNVPAVLLLIPLLRAKGPVGELQWLILAASSTLAGNATILGAAANVIVVQMAAAQGVEVSFWRFAKGGLAISAVTLVASLLVLVGYSMVSLI